MPEYIKIVCWVLFTFSLWDIYTTIASSKEVRRMRSRGIPASVYVWAILVTVALVAFDVVWISYNITGGK